MNQVSCVCIRAFIGRKFESWHFTFLADTNVQHTYIYIHTYIHTYFINVTNT